MGRDSNPHTVSIAGAGGGGSQPTWLANQTTNTWSSLNTRLSDVNPCPLRNCSYSAEEGQTAVMDDWCGGVGSTTSLMICAQGGHHGYAGNEAYVLNLNTASPAWARETSPSTNVPENVGYYPDGKPSSRHGYGHDCFIPSGITNGNRWFSPLAVSVYGNGGGSTNEVASYIPGSGAYDTRTTFPDFPGNNPNDWVAAVAWDSGQNLVWVKEGCNNQTGGMYSFNPATKVWSSRMGGWVRSQSGVVAKVDPIRRIFLVLSANDLYGIDLSSPSSDPVTITRTGTGPTSAAPGLAYDPISQCFLAWGGGSTVYKLTPPGTNWKTGTWTWTTLTNAGGGATPTSANSNGTYGRFQYISALRCLVVVNRTTELTYVYKLPAGSV